MNAILKTHNLTKKYGNQLAVNSIDITVRSGEIYCFLGRNGAGKTTTIKMLLGLVEPTEGEIECFGQNLKRSKKDILKRIGSTIEAPGFYPNLTAYENLKINAKLIGIQKNSAIDEALETVGLLEEKNKLVKNFSLGMKQRLGIARAILHKPELLILDEPTNGLDPVGIKDTRRLIKSLAEKRDITIFMSSHILSEVEQLATTVGIIHEGKLLEEISFEKLRKKNRKYISLKVSNDSKATMILERKLNISDYEVHGENEIRIYSHYDKVGEINKTLIENQVLVTKLCLSEDNLEDYFTKLTGGISID
ncbi:ABC transporter ATP-binding protein [Thermohalobacter berrensis]|uniref:Bacitracin ABC transporter ATP-binding protein n=1 Tax=Thermohalobacter berrensis TaxID=99594 RepID=A0A419SV21_9FIRM|nr:ABC transporter ATP-binding protein [Thermohalobacter berrensis]RKD29070.1 bacitracin ABC transporter ATP-binding protein [Thermohalobacter berrensis]